MSFFVATRIKSLFTKANGALQQKVWLSRPSFGLCKTPSSRFTDYAEIRERPNLEIRELLLFCIFFDKK